MVSLATTQGIPKARILLVEDENIVALELMQRVRGLGYGIVRNVRRGEDAITVALDAHPDLVLMDISLAGEIDGIEAACRIREVFPATIVFLTANTDEATRERARQANPAGYLLKPFTEGELAETIDGALARAT